ncbi:expressed unknown protein [Seminavis robusta]|uniref:Uncharacterized protein n=1 Tax=Seminavis robusta TaxID=568900 RepID=A0A9N8DB58_9STRA|nr:expressed unknown protein [Seminavis robusta]|eukprot:Sro17_g012210.1 n/a (270) ;mRNA; r:54090-54986
MVRVVVNIQGMLPSLIDVDDGLLLWAVCLIACLLIASSMVEIRAPIRSEEKAFSPQLPSATRTSGPESNDIKRAKTNRREVTFSSSVQEVVPSQGVDVEKHKQQIWWRSKDIKKMKSEASLIAFELKEAEQSHLTPFCYTATITRIFEACCVVDTRAVADVEEGGHISPVDRKYLGHWMTVGTLRMGLEKKIVRSMAKDCTALRSQVIQSVLKAQEDCKGDEEAIRKASIERSRPTQLFAVVVGQCVASSCASEQAKENAKLKALASPA